MHARAVISWGALALLLAAPAAARAQPRDLPHYDVAITLDVRGQDIYATGVEARTT